VRRPRAWNGYFFSLQSRLSVFAGTHYFSSSPSPLLTLHSPGDVDFRVAPKESPTLFPPCFYLLLPPLRLTLTGTALEPLFYRFPPSCLVSSAASSILLSVPLSLPMPINPLQDNVYIRPRAASGLSPTPFLPPLSS